MLDNTAFILFSDHGVNIPSDGISNWKDKFLTNQRLNVPLLIRCPWMMKNNKFHNNFFVESSIDLLPTVMEIAGINSFNSSDYSLSCMSQKIGTKNFKDYAVSEYIWEGEYKCKIHTFKYIYNREFNWLNDNEEKEFIIDIKTNKKIKIKSTLYFELITYFRDINKKLNLKTLKCKN